MKLGRALIPTLAFSLLLAGGASPQITKPVESHHQAGAKVTFKCSPARLYQGDTLTLDMSVPHGGDLAIVSPDRTFFFISFWQPDEAALPQSLFDWEGFRSTRRIKLDTTRLKVKPWARGSDAVETVFKRTGWYKVLLSENLETDDGTPVSECRVHYTNRRRK